MYLLLACERENHKAYKINTKTHWIPFMTHPPFMWSCPTQTFSAAAMYFARKFLTSEMCMVSLMVVSRLLSCTSPLSRVLSLITTVNRTPISSYLQTHKHAFKDTGLEANANKLHCLKSTRDNYLSCSDDGDVLSRCPGHDDIPPSSNSCSKPSQT